MGEAGVVNHVNVDENKVKVMFVGHSAGITLSTKSVKMVC